MKHPGTIPSPYATVRVDYGSEFKHLYSLSEWSEDLRFWPDLHAAVDDARETIENDPKAVIAVLKVEQLMAAKAEVVTVAPADQSKG